MPYYEISQRLTFDKLHGKEGTTIEFTDFVDGNNIWMIQPGRGLGFTPKPGTAVGVLTKMRRKELEGNLAIELGILG